MGTCKKPEPQREPETGGGGGGSNCGNPLDKKNPFIKKAKIKVDPRSVNANCDGGQCLLTCKPGLVFDKGSKGVKNDAIILTCGKTFLPAKQKARCIKPKKKPPQRSSGVLFNDFVENDQTKCSNSIYDKEETTTKKQWRPL